jgi:two-component system sensor histidine kinase UhpB
LSGSPEAFAKVFCFFFSKKKNPYFFFGDAVSLRFRLLGAIFLALLIGFSVGAGLAAWHAARTVRDELSASMASARQSSLAALANLPAGDAGAAELRRMVGAFDGDRHVRAVLAAADGSVLAASLKAPVLPPPIWFLRLMAPPPAGLVQDLPGGGQFRLAADAAPEAAERWSELRALGTSFAVFFGVAVVLCSVVLGRALRPLTALAAGFARVGRGELQAELAPAGPPEIAVLAASFNRMAADLRAAEAQNRRLAAQLMTIAEEERAEIARDLHDDIGPLLFATTNFAAAIGRMAETGAVADVPAQVRAIQESVGQVQREVRDMLGRLHAGDAAPADLADAVAELVRFWRGVRPEIGFAAEMALEGAILGNSVRECLFRAAQEGLSNAVRHGQPRHVWVRAWLRDGSPALSVRDDGETEAGSGPGQGLGLAGMRARAAALGGRVEIVRGGGWEVIVSLPAEVAA